MHFESGSCLAEKLCQVQLFFPQTLTAKFNFFHFEQCQAKLFSLSVVNITKSTHLTRSWIATNGGSWSTHQYQELFEKVTAIKKLYVWKVKAFSVFLSFVPKCHGNIVFVPTALLLWQQNATSFFSREWLVYIDEEGAIIHLYLVLTYLQPGNFVTQSKPKQQLSSQIENRLTSANVFLQNIWIFAQ